MFLHCGRPCRWTWPQRIGPAFPWYSSGLETQSSVYRWTGDPVTQSFAELAWYFFQSYHRFLQKFLELSGHLRTCVPNTHVRKWPEDSNGLHGPSLTCLTFDKSLQIYLQTCVGIWLQAYPFSDPFIGYCNRHQTIPSWSMASPLFPVLTFPDICIFISC